jgi:prepilin signal peptidase PulO-like enzyme (type II secretory pathway)
MEPLSTVSGERPATEKPLTDWAPPAWAIFAAAALAVGTVVRFGFSANGVAWAIVQVVLVGVAAYDFATHRVKNAVTIPTSIVALLLRAVLEPHSFVEVLVTGLVAFLAFFALALLLRGGLGMGDVKLAAMLGFLLGEKVLPALLFGTLAGGIAAAFLLSRTAQRRDAMAYGPYLALGAVAAILVSHPPALV